MSSRRTDLTQIFAQSYFHCQEKYAWLSSQKFLWSSTDGKHNSIQPTLFVRNITSVLHKQWAFEHLQVSIANSRFTVPIGRDLKDSVFGKVNKVIDDDKLSNTEHWTPDSLWYLCNSKVEIVNSAFIEEDLSTVLLPTRVSTLFSQGKITNVLVENVNSENSLVHSQNASHSLNKSGSLVGENVSSPDGESQENRAEYEFWFGVGPNSTLTATDSLFMEHLSNRRGAIIASESDTTLMFTNSRFVQQSALGRKGIIQCSDGANIKIRKCLFQHITCGHCSGIIVNTGNSATVMITASQIVHNIGYHSLVHTGQGSLVTIENTIFHNNTCTLDGMSSGIIYCGRYSNVSVQHSSFENNKAQVTDTNGDVNILFNHCSFRHNVAWGNIISVGENSALHINSSIFHMNSPLYVTDASYLNPWWCSVIYVSGQFAYAMIESSKFSNNNLTGGRAVIRGQKSRVTLKKCHIFYNQSDTLFFGSEATFIAEFSTFAMAPASLTEDLPEAHTMLDACVLLVRKCVFLESVFIELSVGSSADFSSSSLPAHGRVAANVDSSLCFHLCDINNGTSDLFLVLLVTVHSSLTVGSCNFVGGIVSVSSESYSTIVLSESTLEDTALHGKNSIIHLNRVEVIASVQSNDDLLDFGSVLLLDASMEFQNCQVTMRHCSIRCKLAIDIGHSNVTLSGIQVVTDKREETKNYDKTLVIQVSGGMNNSLTVLDTICTKGVECLSLTLAQMASVVVQNSTLEIEGPSKPTPSSTTGIGTIRLCDILITQSEQISSNSVPWPQLFRNIFTWNVTTYDGGETIKSSEKGFLAKLLSNRKKQEPSERDILFSQTSNTSEDKIVQSEPLSKPSERYVQHETNEKAEHRRTGTKAHPVIHLDTPFAAGEV